MNYLLWDQYPCKGAYKTALGAAFAAIVRCSYSVWLLLAKAPIAVGFFSQFGVVTNRKVSRNKKTGKAKHYAFVEFQLPEVAAIAAEAMNGYMLFTQKLVCHVLRAAEVREDLFKGTNRRFRKVNWQQIEEKRHNQERTPEQQVHWVPILSQAVL